MLKIVICMVTTISLFSEARAFEPVVMNGIDILAGQHFQEIRGKRVGLITNQTGRTFTGASSIEIIRNAPEVRLVALFSPEHGLDGSRDDKYSSNIDKSTGLPVYSLYGHDCKPTPEMLRGIDVLVFDLQSIGTRFYTYIGTLSLAMQSARQAGIEFMVLDRPDPIDGIDVGGAIPEEFSPLKRSGCSAITSIHAIPTRHGMTVGELAEMFNDEFGIGCNLHVIPMSGWRRSMYFNETGQKWVNPSPNMTSLTEAILYPGFGMLESTNLSVGRGTSRPFEVFGAPWLDSDKVISNLSHRRLLGIGFSPCQFVPSAPYPYAGKLCHGVQVTITNRAEVDPILGGLQLLQAVAETHPNIFKSDRGFATEIGNSEVWDLLVGRKKTPHEIVAGWNDGLEDYKKIRARYLIY